MEFGLSLEDIKSIISVFKKYEEVEIAVLYGSRAKGNFKNASDIDLTFVGDNLNMSLVGDIELELDDLLLPYTFDISIKSQISNPDLIDHIDRVGQVFYKKENITQK